MECMEVTAAILIVASAGKMGQGKSRHGSIFHRPFVCGKGDHGSPDADLVSAGAIVYNSTMTPFPRRFRRMSPVLAQDPSTPLCPPVRLRSAQDDTTIEF